MILPVRGRTDAWNNPVCFLVSSSSLLPLGELKSRDVCAILTFDGHC